MTRSKKIFVAFAIMFAVILALVVIDLSRRTTFPGSDRKPAVPDTVRQVDSLQGNVLSGIPFGATSFRVLPEGNVVPGTP